MSPPDLSDLPAFWKCTEEAEFQEPSCDCSLHVILRKEKQKMGGTLRAKIQAACARVAQKEG